MSFRGTAKESQSLDFSSQCASPNYLRFKINIIDPLEKVKYFYRFGLFSTPVEFAELLRSHGYNAPSVKEENLCGKPDENIIKVCLQENRILVTLDLDFADINLSSR